jgi:3-methylcrotonyl-CoA carboxylase alpha subunit
MFKKIVIANRGEIAVRIMATCREMGVRTVAVYSDADHRAHHVREADEVYYIGPSPASQSYLRIDTIIDVAKQSGAEAIHPGYGFLSENVNFVEACDQAGIVFIGPPASAMRLMGSKIAAKQLAQSVGAPTIPGYNGDSQDDAILMHEAECIGFPLLIKASSGGGGKGMREVHTASDFLEQLAGARRETYAAFGDPTVFLERLIRQPRHIEIQVLGDMFGNLVHLGERECSIQRRHQKIVEESPSIALTPALRHDMGTAALRIAKAAGYVNAGTLEFMLDTDKQFYFLEMNTRLQVEHPVTELVTGFDLVRQQLRIASGEPLDINQEQVHPRGHAIEVRLYAEDPDHNFIPSTGTVTRFIQPQGPGIRVDSGIENGDEITQYYDPMIAKLIVYGEDRAAAIARLQRALEQTAVFGVKTNDQLLLSIAKNRGFQEGQTYTNFLEESRLIVDGYFKQDTQTDLLHDALVAATLYDVVGSLQARNGHRLNSDPWLILGPWRMTGGSRQVTFEYQGEKHKVALWPVRDDTGTWRVQSDDSREESVTPIFGNNNLLLLKRGSTQTRTYVQRTEGVTQVAVNGQIFRLERRQPPDVDTAALAGNTAHAQETLTAPMAGTIVKVQVQEGDTVEERQVLVILSAMKMEHTISAPYAGKINRIHYA